MGNLFSALFGYPIRLLQLIGSVWGRLGVLSFSLFVTLAVPSIPIELEMADKGVISSQSILVTVIILAATFLASAERAGFRTLYGFLIMAAVILDTGHSNWARASAEQYAFMLLLATAALHASERLIWHVVQKRPFPNEGSPLNG